MNIVMEFANAGTLEGVIKEHARDGTKIKEEYIKKVLFQILLGLRHCHDRKILHRDIKPENIFLSDEGKVVKLGDFGISKMLESHKGAMAKTQKGTLAHMSPEVYMGKQYDSKSDIWAIGTTLYSLMTKDALFKQKGIGEHE